MTHWLTSQEKTRHTKLRTIRTRHLTNCNIHDIII